ncbi:MAG TPA: cyclase family protein [Thermoanaerobaculia bacterium]
MKMCCWLAALSLLLLASGPLAAVPKGPDLARAKVIDLSYSFDEKTIYWPTSPSSFQLEKLAYGDTPAGYFYSSYSFCTPEHGGTHLDAPIHFSRAGRTTDQIPLRQLIAPAVVIDISSKAAADTDYRLSGEDVRAWEKAHGTIAPGTIVLLRTGWGNRWPDRKRYLGDDTPGDASHLHFPSYGKDAAELLVRERKIGALGVDTASIDHGASKDFIVHQVAMAAQVPGLENLAHLEDVPPTGAWVIALPMKIAGGSGGPLRIVALVPE